MTERVGKITLVERGDIWVFAYGSLMWDPGFRFADRQPALLRGWHRAFCVGSPVYRGTRERPGLVLGLIRGGSCRGFAMRVAAAERRTVMTYLETREMPEDTYTCRRLKVTIPSGTIRAYGFVANPDHQLYTGLLSLPAIARRILDSVGDRGPNRAYLANTVRHLDELGLPDTSIHAIHRAVEELAQKRR